VTYTFIDLEVSLAELPTLRDVLGKDWIKREKRTSPVESKFPLARMLRIRELQHLMISLDRRLGDLWYVKGARDWRNRLRTNGQETRELLTEISFADLLWQRGYEFQHPDDGPDFAIAIEGGPPLMVEAYTPRIIAWDDDLGTRLWMLGREFDYSVEMEPAGDERPILSEQVTERMMQQIVAVALGRLRSATVDRSHVTQMHPDVGLRIEWTPSSNPGFRKRNAPDSSPTRAFNYVWTAAERKAKQLKDAAAHTLLLGTNQLPFSEWAQYVASVRNNVPFYGFFDWSQIHPQVDRIIVYQATYADGAYPTVDVWERPGKETCNTDSLYPFLEMLRSAAEDERRQSANEERDLVRRLVRFEAMKRQAREPS
jgi:hypothetical protein